MKYYDYIIILLQAGTFIEHLKSNTTLRGLNLSGCGLTSICAESLGEILTTNTHLERLSISNNTELGIGGIQHLSRALKANQGLKKLDLTACRLTSRSVESLAEALTTNAILEELDVSYNTLHIDSTERLSHALEVNQCLRVLNLNLCSLNSRSVKSLAEALKTNKHLEELNINGNKLRDDGVQHLAHALRVNQHLKTLQLANCGVTDNGLKCLAEAIQHNHALGALFVHNLPHRNIRTFKNPITKGIIPVLIEYLQINCTLTELYIPNNLESCTSSIKEAVNDVRKRSGLPLIEVKSGVQ